MTYEFVVGGTLGFNLFERHSITGLPRTGGQVVAGTSILCVRHRDPHVVTLTHNDGGDVV